MNTDPELHRTLGLPSLVFFGLGTMVGGGIYALLGQVAGLAGPSAPIAFLFSGALALVTAASFAELSSRFPWAAGAAAYVKEGFGSSRLAVSVGGMVILTGVVSAATLTVAAVGFLQDFVSVPPTLAIILLTLLMGGLAAWGVGASVMVVVLITVVEVAALIAVVVLEGDVLAELPAQASNLLPDPDGAGWLGVASGAFLAFYAFLGFEDMANMAEEVQDVRRNLPRAIMISISLTIALYVVVSLVAVLALPVADLAQSRTPMALIIESHGPGAVAAMGMVSLLTGLNGALVQIIMASRVAYGLSKRGEITPWFAAVHASRRTPVRATAVMTGLIMVLALFLPLMTLAKITSAIILVVFALVNLALWRVKGQAPDMDGEGPRWPRWLPMLGALVCGVLLFGELVSQFG